MKSRYSPLTQREIIALEKRLEDLQIANLSHEERIKRMWWAEELAKIEANLRKLDRQIRRSRRQVVPDGEQILSELFSVTNKKQLVEVCKRRLPPSFINEIDPTTLMVAKQHKVYDRLGKLLLANADKFIAAKNDPRFPSSSRESSYEKRIWFVARVLAGAIHGLSSRTALDRIPASRR